MTIITRELTPERLEYFAQKARNPATQDYIRRGNMRSVQDSDGVVYAVKGFPAAELERLYGERARKIGVTASAASTPLVTKAKATAAPTRTAEQCVAEIRRMEAERREPMVEQAMDFLLGREAPKKAKAATGAPTADDAMEHLLARDLDVSDTPTADDAMDAILKGVSR